MLSKLTRTFLVTTTSLTLMAGLIPTAHATTHHPQPASVSTNETTQQSTPANLPYRPLSEIRAEAQAKGLDADATELAIELQKVVNAYHNLPNHLKELPYDYPAVQDALLASISPSLARGATTPNIDIGAASACAKAVVTTLVKRGTAIGVVWSAIEVIGGVTEFAQGMSEILNNRGQQNLQDLVTERWGKEMGFLLGRVIGYTAIVNACKDLRV